MRTSLSALLLAAAFVTTAGAAKAQSINTSEYAGNTAIEFATKGRQAVTVAPIQNDRPAPVFSANQSRGLNANATHLETSGK